MTADMMIHLDGGPINGSVTTNEHEYSCGPYPVVKLQLGAFSFTVFPRAGERDKLADTLAEMAEALRAANAECDEAAAALRD